MIIQSGGSSLEKKTPSWLKKILTREFLSQSSSHAVRVFYLFNCATEFCPIAWNQQKSCSSRRVYSPGKLIGYIHIFPFFFLTVKDSITMQRDSPCCRLSSPLLLAACSPLCLLVMKLLPIFHTMILVGFPLDIRRLWSEVGVLSNDWEKILCSILHAMRHAGCGISDAEVKTNGAFAAKLLRIICKNAG